MYTVKQAAALTGVTEATLRVWERRYGIVHPVRSPGGYRLYDDSQVAQLREMAYLVQGGVPASRAAETILTAAPSRVPGETLRGLPAEDDLVAAAASLEPARLRGVIEQAFASGPFEQLAQEWLQPQLRLLGDAWASGRLSIAQEHFATAGLMRALARAFDEAGPTSGGASVVVGLPAGERHELALLAFATCLRRCGTDVVYLGADVPLTEWVHAADARRPRAAVLGVNSAPGAVEAQRVIDALATISPPLSVWTGGSHRQEVRGARMMVDAVSEAAEMLHLSLTAGGA